MPPTQTAPAKPLPTKPAAPPAAGPDTRARLTAAWRSAADRMAGAAYPQALIAETMLLVAAERLAAHYGEAVVADFLHMAEEDMRGQASPADRQGVA